MFKSRPRVREDAACSLLPFPFYLLPYLCIYLAIFEKWYYLSTDGAGQIPTEYLKQVKDVVIAVDNDEPGQSMAQRLKTQLPNATRKIPSSIDWNQDLVNTFDWANQKRSNEINRQHERGIERGGGLSL